MDGDFAVHRWAGESALLNQRVCKVKTASEELDQSFLYWYLHPHIARIHGETPETTVRHLSTKDVETIPFPQLDPAEQLCVARILDIVDTAIRQTEAIIEKLKQVKQGLLHDLLTRGIDENDELRPPQSEAPHLYKQSPLGWIPKDWQDTSVESIAAAPICYGIVQVGAYNSGGVPVVAIRDLERDLGSEINRTDPRLDAMYARSRIVPGDVLLSIKGTTGRVGVVPPQLTGNISRDIARIRPGPTVRSWFLCHLLRSTLGQHLLQSIQVGTTRAELSIAPLRRLLLPIPTLSEQERLEERFAKFENRVEQELSVLGKLRSTRNGLMSDLLTGRVRVTPLLNSDSDHPQSAIR
jgi:type I restriction enzyme S subunit